MDPVVARIAWDFPEGRERELQMRHAEAVLFGRSERCQISVGRLPHDSRVPSVWGRISWDRRLRVENLAERTARWAFTLVPVASQEGRVAEGPHDVLPGMECSLASERIEIHARVPGPLGDLHVIRVSSRQAQRFQVLPLEQPSVREVHLTESERRVGTALITPLDRGMPAPWTYGEIADVTDFARESVRDIVERIDAKFSKHGLYADGVSNSAPLRVALVLRRMRFLLDP